MLRCPQACQEPGRGTKKRYPDRHQRSEHGVAKLVCGINGCQRAFILSDLEQHELTHGRKPVCLQTADQRWRCQKPGCNKTYQKSNSLHAHHRSAHGARKLVCGIDGCRKAFTTAGNRKRHGITHVKACLHCGKRQAHLEGCRVMQAALAIATLGTK